MYVALVHYSLNASNKEAMGIDTHKETYPKEIGTSV